MSTTLDQAREAMEARLRERLLLARAVPGDRLMLSDGVLLAALDGSRKLTPNERKALEQSPLTLRRFRHLSLERHARAQAAPAANDSRWSGSAGMLRAAASAVAIERLVTDDGYWTLHFLSEGDGWQVILALSVDAPFSAWILCEQSLLRVVDGGGAVVLQGRLDGDGECESAWPFAMAPAQHFQLHGARFAVEPVAP